MLTNGRIVDPATKRITAGALWIRDGRIAGRGEQPPGDTPGERLDLQGRWIIPGLNDLHTHSFGNAAPGGVSDGGGTEATATRVLRAGVTSFLDLFGMEDYLFQLRDRQRAREIGGAEIFAAGPCFTATRGHCSEYGVPTRLIDTPEDSRRHLTELAPKRPDVVKVVYDHFDYGPTSLPSIDRATLEALGSHPGKRWARPRSTRATSWAASLACGKETTRIWSCWTRRPSTTSPTPSASCWW